MFRQSGRDRPLWLSIRNFDTVGCRILVHCLVGMLPDPFSSRTQGHERHECMNKSLPNRSPRNQKHVKTNKLERNKADHKLTTRKAKQQFHVLKKALTRN